MGNFMLRVKRVFVDNAEGERIDVLVEGRLNSPISIVFVHGFGTNKDEGAGLFIDISSALKEYCLIRFDFTGYGKSEGKQEDVNLGKEASDLKSVLEFVHKEYGDKILLIGMSLGCYAISLLSPGDISKTIFISPPDSDQEATVERLVDRIKSRKGGIVDFNGATIYLRSSGEIQKIGPAFWKSLNEFNAEAAITTYSHKTNLVTIIPIQDEIFERKNMDVYDKQSTRCIRLRGNHAFTDPEERKELVAEIVRVLKTRTKTKEY